MPDEKDVPETVASTVASTASGWQLDPERRPPSMPTFDRTEQRFALGAELGRGGMGRVVEATDLALDRTVAIKQATVAAHEDLLRFEREVRITARLEHPSIPPVHEAGRDPDGRPFYVMRRVEGDRLADRLRAANTPRARLALVPNVLAAVDAAAFAHARGVIHRDIKPANILVGAYGETLLIDWGLARRLDETDVTGPRAMPRLDDAEPLTRAGAVYGTPGYMAPEQARGEPVDTRADVYALGATLLHVLVGRADPDVAIEDVDAAVPPELVAIVGKAMAQRADERYPDGGALAADLRAFLAGQLVAAHRYTARERLGRFVRKHRVAVLVSAVALVGAIAIGVVSIVGLSRARDRAEAERALADDRNELMLLDRASTLAPIDPTRAVALLRQLPAGSPHLRRARDIAAAAAAAGIMWANSAAAGSASIHFLAISPDNRWLASGARDGTIRLHELASGATRTLAKVGVQVGGIVWTDGGSSLCVLAADGLSRIAVASGQRVILEPAVRAGGLWVGPRDDRVRYIDTTQGVLAERSTREAEPAVVLARDVEYGHSQGDVSLIGSKNRIALVDGGREIRLFEQPTTLWPQGFAIAGDGSRVAAATGTAVIEWTRDGRELYRYPMERVASLQYGKYGLYVATDSEIASLAKGVSIRLRDNHQVIVWAGMTAHGPAFVAADGSVTMIDNTGVQVIPGEPSSSRGIAAAPHSGFLATGSLDGRVRWWNLDQRSPRVVPGAAGEVCGVDRETLYTYSPGQPLNVTDRASGRVQVVDHALLRNAFHCVAMLPHYLVLATPSGHDDPVIVDRRTLAIRKLPGVKAIRADGSTHVLVLRRGRELVETSGAPGDETVRWTAPAEIQQFTLNGRWLAAQAGSLVVRIDRTTNAVAKLELPGTALVGVTSDGRLWWMAGSVLWTWDGATTREVRKLTAPPYLSSAFEDYLALWLEDGSIWAAHRDSVVNRAQPGQRNVRFGRGQAVHLEGGGGALVVRFLATGEQITRRSYIRNTLYVSDDGLLAVANGTQVLIYEDAVPADPAELRGWLDRATNAWLDPETGELTFR